MVVMQPQSIANSTSSFVWAIAAMARQAAGTSGDVAGLLSRTFTRVERAPPRAAAAASWGASMSGLQGKRGGGGGE